MTHFGVLLRSMALAGAIGANGATSVSAQDTTRCTMQGGGWCLPARKARPTWLARALARM